jgi:hypothetical protein
VPKEYYKAFMSLLVNHGVLFENYYLNEKEHAFTKKVFLPAFIEVYEKTGYKPMIVSIEPTDNEGDQYWYSHPAELLEMVDRAMKRNRGPTDGAFQISYCFKITFIFETHVN